MFLQPQICFLFHNSSVCLLIKPSICLLCQQLPIQFELGILVLQNLACNDCSPHIAGAWKFIQSTTIKSTTLLLSFEQLCHIFQCPISCCLLQLNQFHKCSSIIHCRVVFCYRSRFPRKQFRMKKLFLISSTPPRWSN